MWQFLGYLMLFGLLMTTAKIAIILLILAGLIFRTKETVGVLVIGGILTAFSNYPWTVTLIATTLALLGYYFRRKELQVDAVPALPDLTSKLDS